MRVGVHRRVGTPPLVHQRRARRDVTSVVPPPPPPPPLRSPAEMITRETVIGEETVPAQRASPRPRPLSETTTAMLGVAVEGRGQTWTRVGREATGAPAEARRRLIAIRVMIETFHPLNLYNNYDYYGDHNFYIALKFFVNTYSKYTSFFFVVYIMLLLLYELKKINSNPLHMCTSNPRIVIKLMLLLLSIDGSVCDSKRLCCS